MGRKRYGRERPRDEGGRGLKGDISKDSRELNGRSKVAKGRRKRRSNEKEEVLG